MDQKFTLHIMDARNLRDCDIIGKSDPFCIVKVGGAEIGKTRIVKNSQNPVWDEKPELFQFTRSDLTTSGCVEILVMGEMLLMCTM